MFQIKETYIVIEKRKNFVTNMNFCDIPCRLTAPNNFIIEQKKKPSDFCFI